MKLIQLKCPSCGSNIETDGRQTSFTCSYCGQTALIDNETIKIEHVVIDNSLEEEYKRIDTCYQLGYYSKALSVSKELSEKYPYDARVWLYLIRSLTEDYSNYYVDVEKIKEWYGNYIKIEEDLAQKLLNQSIIDTYIIECEKNKDSSTEIRCPFCDHVVSYGDEECDWCGETLYWPE